MILYVSPGIRCVRMGAGGGGGGGGGGGDFPLGWGNPPRKKKKFVRKRGGVRVVLVFLVRVLVVELVVDGGGGGGGEFFQPGGCFWEGGSSRGWERPGVSGGGGKPGEHKGKQSEERIQNRLLGGGPPSGSVFRQGKKNPLSKQQQKHPLTELYNKSVHAFKSFLDSDAPAPRAPVRRARSAPASPCPRRSASRPPAGSGSGGRSPGGSPGS